MRRTRYWEWRINALKERLRVPLQWYPVPMLLAFGLVLLLGTKTLPGLNPRIGQPAHILAFDAPVQKDGAIWFSLSVDDDMIVATTGDRQVFHWPLERPSPSELSGFRKFLKGRVQDITYTSGLSGRASSIEASAVIAADEHLNYAHIQPVLYALAEAGISHYAFETRVLKVAASEHHPGHHTE